MIVSTNRKTETYKFEGNLLAWNSIAGVDLWKKAILSVFRDFEIEMYKQKERGKVGKLSNFLATFFPKINKDQIGFIIKNRLGT